MTTRKAIALVNGLFQEVNTPTDGLDFAGNTTTDLTEGTNLYYLDSRARASVSVTDLGGDGSLSYDNSTGVITYTGPSAAEARAHLSVAAGSGLTYNSTTGEFGTSAIPNAQLANSSVTLGSTSVSLGATETTFTGLTSLTSTTLVASTTLNVGAAGAANSIQLSASGIAFEGATGDGVLTTIVPTDPTVARTITLPDATGTVALLSTLSAGDTGTGYGSLTYNSATGAFTYAVVTDSNIRGAISVTDSGGDGSLSYDNSTGVITYVGPSASEVRAHLSVAVGSGLTYNSTTGEFGTSNIPNSQLQNSSFTLGSTSIALGSTATTIAGLLSLTSDSIYVGASGAANSIVLNSSGITFEGATADAFETLVTVVDPTADRTFTLPDETGTAATQEFATAIAIALG
jgi:hypothetical protein